MSDSQLNHLFMILIFNEELEEINLKLRANKLHPPSRTMRSYLFLLTNPSTTT